MFRLLTSRRALVAGFVTALVSLTGLAYNLDVQREDDTLRQVVAEARLIGQLLLEVELVPGAPGGPAVLAAGAVDRIDRRVAHLLAEGDLIGVQLWTRDGELVYSDQDEPDPLSAEEQAAVGRALAGEPQVEFEHDEGRELPSATVLLQPGTDGGGDSALVAEVLLPGHDTQGDLTAASWRLYSGTAVLLVLGSVLAMAARRRMLRREHEALHDPLTGLGNRALLAAESGCLQSGRTTASAALLLLDLDGFKDVNDTLGHDVGDLLLVEVAGALRASVRSTDVVVRLGGDEFAVLLRDLPDAGVAARSARAIADVLHRPFAVDRVTLEVGVSIGVAVAPEHGSDLGTLLRRADVAMYQAKRDGGGVRVYDEADDPHDESQLDLLAQLRAAISGGQLRLQYQPKVGLRAGRAVGFEALVRWAHPERGMLAPGEFLPLAERTALMRPLTDWVLREAIGRCAQWRAAGWDVDVSVNIAPATLLEADFPARVTDLLVAGGLPGSALELEITETAVMVDPVRAAETLRRLQTMGVAVSIDDFGAGYTSLAYLKSLPVQSLKIDRRFVTNLLGDARDEAVTRSVVSLGHDLGLTVIAEGVETADVRQRLTELGCDQAQGYLLARPMDATAVHEWLAGEAAAQVRSSPRATETPEWVGTPSSGSTETSTRG